MLVPPFFYILSYFHGLYLSSECLLNFLSNLYILPWACKILKFMLFRLLENTFGSQKIIYPSSGGKLLIPQAAFFFGNLLPLVERVGRGGECGDIVLLK